MKVKNEALICNACNNKSICKFTEEAKKVTDAYAAFVSSTQISENCVFHLTDLPIVFPYRVPNYMTR